MHNITLRVFPFSSSTPHSTTSSHIILGFSTSHFLHTSLQILWLKPH